MNGKIQVRLAVLSALAALVALIAGATAAQADSEKYFSIDVQPAIVAGGSETTFEITITNLDNNQLGAVEVTSPFDFDANSDAELTDHPSGKNWTLTADPATDTFTLTADSQSDRLTNGESLVVELTASVPAATEFDVIFDFDADGRQANNFNDTFNGNAFTRQDVEDGFFTGRLDPEEDGVYELITVQAYSHQVLVVNGSSEECTPDDGCFVAAGETGEIQAWISADCGNGTVVIEAGESVIAGTTVSGAFYSYFDGDCDANTVVTLTIVYPKSLDKKPGQLEMFLDYGGKPGLPDGTEPLDDCKQDADGVDCVQSITGGSDGTVVVLKARLTDPSGFS